MKKKWIAAGVFAVCSVLVCISYFYWDLPIACYFRQLDPGMKKIAEVVTGFGIATWYIAGSLALFLFFRYVYKNELHAVRALFVFVALIFAGVLLTLFKWLAGRHRPIDYFAHGYYGFGFLGIGHEVTSFPSGHVQAVFTFATAMTILFPRWGVPLFLYAALISASRVILTAHYLSDVFAGAAVGILCAMAVKYFFDRRQIKLRRDA